MTSRNRGKFLVLYLAPASILEEWSKTDPERRKLAEEKLHGEWVRWMHEHADLVTGTEAAGKPKRVTSVGIAEGRNDIMLYSFVEADSHEEAAKAFQDHPHLQIPQSSIEIMAVRPMGG